MFFTLDDYLKILEWLRRHSIKDSELPTAEDFEGGEYLAMIQNGTNVKVSLVDFAEQLMQLGVPDFINVSSRYNERYISLILAVNLVPVNARKYGQVITFLDTDGNWQLYQFVGESLTQWLNLHCWENLISNISGGLTPDNEDLVIAENEMGDKVVKFKDKKYDEDSFSGLGRVYLRKNITVVEDENTHLGKLINLLTLNMIGKENTIYIILYDYDLNGQTITIPENCVLQFEGGSLRNGKIIGNKTIINSGLIKIFNSDTDFGGTFIIKEIYPQFFGAKGDGITDDSEAIQQTLNFIGLVKLSTIHIPIGTYLLKTPINLSPTSKYYRYNITIKGCGTSYSNLAADSTFIGCTGTVMFEAIGNMTVTFDNIGFKSYGKDVENKSTIAIYASRSTIEGYFSPSIYMHRCSIMMENRPHDINDINSGVGYIGILGHDIESSSFSECEFNADLPIALTSNSKITLTTLDENGYPNGIADTFTYIPYFLNSYDYIYQFVSNTHYSFFNCSLVATNGNPALYANEVAFINMYGCYLASIYANNKKGHALELNNAASLNLYLEEDSFASTALILKSLSFSTIKSYGTRSPSSNIANIIFYNVEDQDLYVYNNNIDLNYNNLLLYISGNYRLLNNIFYGKLYTKSDILNNTISTFESSFKNNKNEFFFIDKVLTYPQTTTIFSSSTLPSTSNRKDSDIWFNNPNNKLNIFKGLGYNTWVDVLGYNSTDYSGNLLVYKGESSTRKSYNFSTGVAGLKFAGFPFYDTDLKKQLNWNGDYWTEYDGVVATIKRYGETSDRPTSTKYQGFQYFDTTLNKPIWWNGTNWVDATGATV